MIGFILKSDAAIFPADKVYVNNIKSTVVAL